MARSTTDERTQFHGGPLHGQGHILPGGDPPPRITIAVHRYAVSGDPKEDRVMDHHTYRLVGGRYVHAEVSR